MCSRSSVQIERIRIMKDENLTRNQAVKKADALAG
jgi:hypothetical protein